MIIGRPRILVFQFGSSLKPEVVHPSHPPSAVREAGDGTPVEPPIQHRGLETPAAGLQIVVLRVGTSGLPVNTVVRAIQRLMLE